MDELTKEKCTACRRDSPRVTDAEVAELRPQIAEWTLIEREGIPRLERVIRFRNFSDSVAFTNRIASLAEDEGHHPAILTEWGRVTVRCGPTRSVRSTATILSWRPKSTR
jgi:4a-hydroxytetrahydrobiopterin dehydratase